MTVQTPSVSPAPTEKRKHYCPPERRKYVLIAGILASAMGFIDGSVVSVALPQMRASLDADFVQAQWISNSYLLMLSALILLGGALGDQLGLRRVFAGGIMVFVVASVWCAVATSIESLLAARVLKGVGAAVMVPGSMAIISLNTPREERGQALGLWVAASSITASLGPLLGGLALTYGGAEAWRWIFAINLPIGAIVLAMLFLRVPNDEPQGDGGLRHLDWFGAALATIALGALAYGLTSLGEEATFQTGIACLLGGAVILAIAIYWEGRLKKNGGTPMIDLKLFSSRAFSGANILTFFVWSGFTAVFFFMPMLLIVGWKLPASYAGGIFLPFSLLISVMSPFIGRRVDRYGSRLFLTLGAVIVGLSQFAMMFAIYYKSFWLGVLPSMMLLGVGIGFCASPLSTAIMNSVSDRYGGAASGINNMVARMTTMFAIAGLGAFVAYIYALIVRAGDLNPEIAELLVDAGFGERLTGGLYQVAIERLQAVAMDHAMMALCIVTAALAFIGALVGWWSQSEGQVVES